MKDGNAAKNALVGYIVAVIRRNDAASVCTREFCANSINDFFAAQNFTGRVIEMNRFNGLFRDGEGIVQLSFHSFPFMAIVLLIESYHRKGSDCRTVGRAMELRLIRKIRDVDDIGGGKEKAWN